MHQYDYLVVGAGLYGAVMAHELNKSGKKCLVIDRRDHIAGNIYCEDIEGIHVHKYGAHIFHTSNKKVWEYMNQFAEFNHYINSPIAVYKDELYNLPFNMNTFSKMWGVRTPQEAKDMIAKQVAETNITEPRNLEEQALSLGGRDVYEKLIKGYTEKQWGETAGIFRHLLSKDCRFDTPMIIIISTTGTRGFRWGAIRQLLRRCWKELKSGQAQTFLLLEKKTRILLRPLFLPV